MSLCGMLTVFVASYFLSTRFCEFNECTRFFGDSERRIVAFYNAVHQEGRGLQEGLQGNDDHELAVDYRIKPVVLCQLV